MPHTSKFGDPMVEGEKRFDKIKIVAQRRGYLRTAVNFDSLIGDKLLINTMIFGLQKVKIYLTYLSPLKQLIGNVRKNLKLIYFSLKRQVGQERKMNIVKKEL